MFSNIGSGEILIVLVVLFFLFGSKKLPEIARGLGQSGKELKKAKKEIENAIQDLDNSETDTQVLSKEAKKKGGDQI